MTADFLGKLYRLCFKFIAGAKKPIGPWFYILGKYIYIPFAIAALVLGIKYGGIG